MLAYNLPPYTYTYYAYITNVDNAVARGSAYYVYAGVDHVTNNLYVNAGGRKNILWCGNHMWMSTTNGADINRGVCPDCTAQDILCIITYRGLCSSNMGR
ncbi:hypothetical protein B0H66DRAFT_554933 [Apodospora peruviana]|uniref:Uncharacterized protein n=1 Tax=Apodospora peruviana TaxID=516989 RepID=A0AAE0ICU0_9PEZI|nr:hypothetical protein B0H66DRAFT_554933 [Apodospora peruviana]